MRPIVISALMLSMASIFVSCENASQLTQNTLGVETPTLRKNPKPPKPDQDPKAELIAFVGDLSGSQTVVGCCPNAGPFPAYNGLTLSGSLPAGTYDGHIFMNGVGRRTNQSYMVQFWTDAMFLEVRGGVSEEDKKNKSLTAEFKDAPMEIIYPYPGGQSTFVPVSFILTRAQQ